MDYDRGTLSKGRNPNQSMLQKINELKVAQKQLLKLVEKRDEVKAQ